MMRLLTTLFILSCLAAPSMAATKPQKAAPAPSTARPVYETDGSFGFCLTDKKYPDGRKLTIAYSPNKQINIGATIPEGKFTVGARYDLTISIDKGEARKIRAATLDEETLLLQMGSNASFRKKLSVAKTLQIGSPSNTIDFDMPDMPTRVKDLESCVQTKVQTRDARAAKVEQMMPETLKAILVTAGFTDIVPLSMDKVPADQRPADFLWKTGNILSGVRERMVPAEKSLSDMVGLHVQGLKKHCPGRFNVQIGREKKASGLALRTADASCGPEDEPNIDKAVAVSILFYLTKDHAFTVFTFEAPTTQTSDARSARDRLADTLLTLAKE